MVGYGGLLVPPFWSCMVDEGTMQIGACLVGMPVETQTDATVQWTDAGDGDEARRQASRQPAPLA